MPFYNRNDTPPAPYASVEVRRRDQSKSLPDVPMLVDTGADVTLVPRWAAEVLGIEITPMEGVSLVGFDGTTNRAMVADVELSFERKTFRGRFHTTDGTYGIIGRDILNLLRVVFDGPGLHWDIVP